MSPINRRYALSIAALVASVIYFAASRGGYEDAAWVIAAKGASVGLLAIWARLEATSRDGRMIAAVLALGALGDVMLETHGMMTGALVFLAGHILACVLYVRNKGPAIWFAMPVAALVAVTAYWLPAVRSEAPGVALYALGLGAMAGTALFSRFPFASVGVGALLFVVSDLLIFARMGPLAGSDIANLLIWPTYFIGQALIAWGVVTTLQREGK
jgi:uncharacterized membrane protein YhhN